MMAMTENINQGPDQKDMGYKNLQCMTSLKTNSLQRLQETIRKTMFLMKTTTWHTETGQKETFAGMN